MGFFNEHGLQALLVVVLAIVVFLLVTYVIKLVSDNSNSAARGTVSEQHQQVSLNVDANYVAAMFPEGSKAMDDCVLKMDEINDVPEAKLLVDGVRATIAAQIGVDVSMVSIPEIRVSGSNYPDCPTDIVNL
jgi:hypothetical protein